MNSPFLASCAHIKYNYRLFFFGMKNKKSMYSVAYNFPWSRTGEISGPTHAASVGDLTTKSAEPFWQNEANVGRHCSVSACLALEGVAPISLDLPDREAGRPMTDRPLTD
jgi:hypothetical protein